MSDWKAGMAFDSILQTPLDFYDVTYANGHTVRYEKERPHGEWIKVEFRTKEEKLFYGDAYRCSHCKVISDTHGSAPYCENCGADMSANDRQVTGKLDDNTTLLYSMTNGDNFIGREGEKE